MGGVGMAALRRRAVALHKDGRTEKSVAAALGISVSSVRSFLAEAKAKEATVKNARREKIAGDIARKSKLAEVDVPRWAEEHGLGDEYRRVCVEADEYAASSHCRSILAGRRASA